MLSGVFPLQLLQLISDHLYLVTLLFCEVAGGFSSFHADVIGDRRSSSVILILIHRILIIFPLNYFLSLSFKKFKNVLPCFLDSICCKTRHLKRVCVIKNNERKTHA